MRSFVGQPIRSLCYQHRGRSFLFSAFDFRFLFRLILRVPPLSSHVFQSVRGPAGGAFSNRVTILV